MEVTADLRAWLHCLRQSMFVSGGFSAEVWATLDRLCQVVGEGGGDRSGQRDGNMSLIRAVGESDTSTLEE